jgi:hypothetical protein
MWRSTQRPSPETEATMQKKIQYKTPLELQTYLWRDNALARPQDLSVAEVIDIRELSARLKTLPTMPPDEPELANSRMMWS